MTSSNHTKIDILSEEDCQPYGWCNEPRGQPKVTLCQEGTTTDEHYAMVIQFFDNKRAYKINRYFSGKTRKIVQEYVIDYSKSNPEILNDQEYGVIFNLS